MKRNGKRLLSLAICLIMVLSMLPVAALAVDTTTLYCLSPDSWSNCNVYWWGSNDTNPVWPGVAMELDDDGIWFCDVPSDATNVIFNNGTDQTGDLLMPTGDKTSFQYHRQTWVTYDELSDFEYFSGYYVAGNMNGWNTAAEGYLMTEGFNDVWYLELSLTAGDYELKVTDGTWENAWGANGANYCFTVATDGVVEVVFDRTTAQVTVTGDCLAEKEPEVTTQVIAEGSATFATAYEAFNGEDATFTPDANGTVTVEILSCDPGYYVDVYADGDWLVDYAGSAADTVSFDVTGGSEVEILICTYQVYSESLKEAAPGSISYKVTFTSGGEQPGGGDTPEIPENQPGSSQDNPKVMTGPVWNYIPGNTTIWYLYDNHQNMVDNGVYSMMLHINSSADYSVSYNGMDVPVDENGFVNYEMKDTEKQGQYLFSVTNNSANEAFFGVEVKERPVYVNNGDVLKVGSTNVTLDPSATYTLYEFTPATTGIYRITTNQGVIGDWGTAFNPQDNTPNKTKTLEWTCTAVGQSIMIGFTGASTARATVIRIGDYVPEVEIPYVIYENTYDFSYQMPADATSVDIDLLDGGFHVAYLGSDGFYHYGAYCGPLMVADLSTVEINLEDAYVNGGLRVWLKDESGETISKTDYNEAMKQYLDAGLVPVTPELVTMLSELGEAKMWWVADGFIFGETVPSNMSQVWMQLCAYLEGTHGHRYDNGICLNCNEKEPFVTPTTPAEIVAAAYALSDGETLQGTYTLTGVVTAINAAYNATYGSITVTIAVEGCEDQPIKCYRLSGEGVDALAVNDVITVTGSLTNDSGSIQFAKGCKLEDWVNPLPEAPYTVSGSVISSDLVEGDVTVELLHIGSVMMSTIATDGHYELGVYTPGAYTLRVSKASHVTREYPIDLEGDGNVQDMEICLLGDVTGDGQIDTGDVARLYAHVKGSTELTDEYAVECSDVNGNGLDIGDVAAIYAHVRGSKPLF